MYIVPLHNLCSHGKKDIRMCTHSHKKSRRREKKISAHMPSPSISLSTLLSMVQQFSEFIRKLFYGYSVYRLFVFIRSYCGILTQLRKKRLLSHAYIHMSYRYRCMLSYKTFCFSLCFFFQLFPSHLFLVHFFFAFFCFSCKYFVRATQTQIRLFISHDEDDVVNANNLILCRPYRQCLP